MCCAMCGSVYYSAAEARIRWVAYPVAIYQLGMVALEDKLRSLPNALL